MRIVLLGATGGCADILDTICDANDAGASFDVLGFLDDKSDLWGQPILGAPVLGGFRLAAEMPDDCYFVTGIGSPYNHWRRNRIIANLGLPLDRFATIRHPSSVVSRWASLGRGVVLHQHAVVTAGAQLADNVLMLPQSVVNHGSTVGQGSIIASSVSISGDVTIGRACYLGAACAIRQNMVIGDGALIAMGSVVVSDVAEFTAVVGNPARFLRNNGCQEEA